MTETCFCVFLLFWFASCINYEASYGIN